MKLKKYEISFEKYLHEGGLPCVDITIKDKKFIFLLDSGSDLSYIDSNIAEDLALELIYTGEPGLLRTMGSVQSTAVKYEVPFVFDGSDVGINSEFVWIEIKKTTNHLKIKFDGIIGLDILTAVKAGICFDDNKLKFSIDEH